MASEQDCDEFGLFNGTPWRDEPEPEPVARMTTYELLLAINAKLDVLLADRGLSIDEPPINP